MAVKKEDRERVANLMGRSINCPKSDLIRVIDILDELGATREAESLSQIVRKLEIYQNKVHRRFSK